jgi:hypothetical protein
MIDFLHTAGSSMHPTSPLASGHAALEHAPDCPREPIPTEAVLRERTRFASLGTHVGGSLTHGETLPDMVHHCPEAVVQHHNAALARLWMRNTPEHRLELQASAGMSTHLDDQPSRLPVGQLNGGLMAQERQPHRTKAGSVMRDPGSGVGQAGGHGRLGWLPASDWQPVGGREGDGCTPAVDACDA